MGWRDGSNAVDYTVNCAVGVPDMTGPADQAEPVNHVLPAWDLLAGSTAAVCLLAAERRRRENGVGQEILVPLSDIAITAMANLGQVGEVVVTGANRPRYGNDLYGAFGRDFLTGDGHRVMIVAITRHQWSGLVRALAIEGAISEIELELGKSFATDEGLRFECRDKLNDVIAHAVAEQRHAELADAFDRHGVCWGPYRGLAEAIRDEPRFISENPVFDRIAHPSGYSYSAPGFAATWRGEQRRTAVPAPELGQHTEEILAEILSCPASEIADLHDRRIVASPA